MSINKNTHENSHMKNHQINPYLSGNYAPVQDELEVKELNVIGEIPKELHGIYMRNGPNPAFPPISYTYPYDGDGMIHAIYLDNGKASYRNQYVQTKGLLKEQKAGKSLYGGILQLMPMDPQWADPEDEPIAVKNGAFIHIIRHGKDYLALSEGAPAYKMTSQLKTLGEWNPYNAKQPIEVCAHTRLDPLNGDLWFINYALTPPYLTIYRFDKEGTAIQKWDIEKSHCSMIHDFVLTENYVIVFDSPVIFDLNQIMPGGSVLNWKPELGLRIGIMSHKDGKMRWFETEPFFVFHFANAYEHENQIIIDYVQHEKLVMLNDINNADKVPPSLYRTIINLNAGTTSHIQLDDRTVEFPRIREDYNTLQHQFIYTPTRTADIHNERAMNALVKYDVKTQQTQVHEFGQYAEIGEAVFAPSGTHKSEDDGYLMLFTYNSTTDQSEFIILDAINFKNEPLARIELPRRIPNGLHGSWMPGAWE
jgi:carotenoid cleavage dioxygenase-like enzyme